MLKRLLRLEDHVTLPPDNDPKFLGIFTKDRQFYRTFFPLLIIIVLQQLAELTVNMVDNIMLGRYTELALSGVTLVNQLQFALQQITAALGVGIVVLASQYWGQRRIEPIKKIISIGLKIGFLVGVIFFTVTLLIPEEVLSLFTKDTAVVAEGTKYLKIICWTYLIFSISSSLKYALQSVETAMISTIMSISTIIINMCLNYCLIFGNFGFEEMGVRGAAIATLTSRIVELVIILLYILFIDKKLKMKLRDMLMLDFTYLKDFVKVATPITITGALWGFAQAVHTGILGHIDSAAIAANAIATVMASFFAVVGNACTNVASVVTGKTIGEEKFDMIRSYTKTMQGVFLTIGIISAALLFIFRNRLVGFYAISDEAKKLTIDFIIVLCVSTVGTCYEYPVACGIIAGGGFTRYSAVNDILFMWLFCVPGALLSAFVFKWPAVVTFAFLKSDQVLKCIPHSIVCNRFRWVSVLTKDE